MQANLGYSAEELEPVDVTEPVNLPAPRQLPPYNGYGSLEDSANSCIHLVCPHKHPWNLQCMDIWDKGVNR